LSPWQGFEVKSPAVYANYQFEVKSPAVYANYQFEVKSPAVYANYQLKSSLLLFMQITNLKSSLLLFMQITNSRLRREASSVALLNYSHLSHETVYSILPNVPVLHFQGD